MSYASEAVNAQAEGINAITAVQRSNAGVKAPGQTLKTFVGTQSLTGAATSIALYTPTAGKNFYLTDFNFSTDIASGTNTDIQVVTGTTASVLVRGSMHSLSPFSLSAIESQPQATGNVPVSIIVASAATTAHIWYDVFGWEE